MKTTALLSIAIVAFLPVAIAAEPPPTEVLLIDHAKLDEAFAKGRTVLANSSFKILAGRRVAPGEVEIHEHDTDIFYIVEGSATFVTGGTAVDPKPTTSGEIRAKEISGGAAHQLTKGDVIVIPSGTPHQFTAVSGTFLYYVVKVTR